MAPPHPREEAVMNRLLRIVIVAVVALGIGAAASAQSKKLQESDLPEPVKAKAAEVTGSGKVTAYWERNEGGRVIYEIDVVADGRAKGVLISPDGAVLVIQAEVPWDELDPNVQAGLKKAAGDGKVVQVHSVEGDGKVQRYIATVDNGGKKSK